MTSFRLLSLAPVFAGLIFVSTLTAQNVTVVSGQGQVLGGTNFLLKPLVVQVTDATTGLPVGAGVPVTWQGSGFNGFFLASGAPQAIIGTDANGISTAYYSLPGTVVSNSGITPVVQNNITATAGNTATFYVTQLASASAVAIAPYILVAQSNIPSGQTLSGAIGTTASPIQFSVEATNGQSTVLLPNVAVQLLNFQDPAHAPLAACASGPNTGANTTLSDASGAVTCTPVFGGQPGQGQFFVTVGGISGGIESPAGFWQALLDPTDANSFPPVQTAWIPFPPSVKINVTPGAPGSIKIISPTGGTQSVTAGATVPLVVETDNAAGLPLSGSVVNWKVVSPSGGVTVSNASSNSDSSGKAVTNVLIGGAVTGPVVVTATLASTPTKSVTFTINVAAPVTITQFQIVSGNNQSTVVNGSFGAPLVVQVSTSAGPGSGVPVQFQVFSGSVILSATTVNTGANGQASVTVTAGAVTGPASVFASVASTTGVGGVTFNLTVLPQAPSLTAANFVNGADLNANSLSPCALGAIVAPGASLGITSVSSTFPGTPVPSTQVQISFSNTPAPVLNIGTNPFGQTQILFQVPCDVVPGSSVPVTVTVNGAATPLNIPVQPASPGIFFQRYSDGVYRAVLTRPDGSFVSLANPARRGDTVVAYVTGLGPTTPTVTTGGVPSIGSVAKVTGTVVPGIGAGGSAELISAKLSEDMPGVYLVAFTVPSSLATGNDVTFSISVIPPGSSTPFNSAAAKVPVQ